MDIFPSNRGEALQRLEEFSRTGLAHYARSRNFVTHEHRNVSRLSAAIRHRLISEEEILNAVFTRHRFPAAEKFVQEVVWRTYWKGWLELHPGVWKDYIQQTAVPLSPEEAGILSASEERGTMAQFTRELKFSGYLHNHARMWWAAWWCHQHKLPWAAGARFFYSHLLDADPASNTLGWRWVAGLQTPGKVYLARRENLAKYWENHPSLRDVEDCVQPHIPEETADCSRITIEEYPEIPPLSPGPSALLGHADDLSIETTPLGELRPAALALVDQPGESDSPQKLLWRRRAMRDAETRWSDHYGLKVERLSRWDEVAQWAARIGCETLVLMAPFTGTDGDAWKRIQPDIDLNGIQVIECRRRWDQRFFPAARAGFFPFWKMIKSTLGRN
jgi:deoxyribodipyrimidine photo-lyase